MFKQFLIPRLTFSPRIAIGLRLTFLTIVGLSFSVNPCLAGDPFRSNNPHKIGGQTEAAFKAIFQQGNYSSAQHYLERALNEEKSEPLAYALAASLAYENAPKNLDALDNYSRRILGTGQNLVASDKLRGNLYIAVGHFFHGAVVFLRKGPIGVGETLGELQQVYDYLDKADSVDPKDPELNLVRGYMDMLLAVNLPFASPDKAIAKLKSNAAPEYLVDRGIALAYRDLKNYPQALDYVNKALNLTADNPEIYYLKAQIEHEKGNREKNKDLLQQAISDFEKALSKKAQLPVGLVKQIQYEHDLAISRLNNIQ